MIGGLPGGAVAGLFYVLCALAAPLLALRRSAGARDLHLGRWRSARRQLLVGLAVLATYAAIGTAVAAFGRLDSPGEGGPRLIVQAVVDAVATLVVYGGLAAVIVAVVVLGGVGAAALAARGVASDTTFASAELPEEAAVERRDLSGVWSTAPVLIVRGWPTDLAR